MYNKYGFYVLRNLYFFFFDYLLLRVFFKVALNLRATYYVITELCIIGYSTRTFLLIVPLSVFIFTM